MQSGGYSPQGGFVPTHQFMQAPPVQQQQAAEEWGGVQSSWGGQLVNGESPAARGQQGF